MGYLWEIDLSSTDINTLGTLAESLKFNFQTEYSSAKNLECSQSLNFEFTINNYKVKHINHFLKKLINIIFLTMRLIDYNVNRKWG